MDKSYVADTIIIPDDYKRITQLLLEADPFVISPSNIKEKYKVDQYRLASLRGDIELKALLDNNIFTRILSLARGERLAGEEQSQRVAHIACAAMCFYIMGGFDIEVNFPMYERAFNNSGDAASDMHYFRIADNLHPQVYANVALGKTDRIRRYDLAFAENEVSKLAQPDCSAFQRVPLQWKHAYLKLLMACMIWKTIPSNLDRVSRYIKWVREQSLFLPAVESFVFLFCSESKMSKMVKGIASDNKDKLIRGIQSAAWDLSYVTYWANKAEQEQGKAIWFLCSNDKVLKRIAESILLVKGHDRDAFLGSMFACYWGARDASMVLQDYRTLEDEIRAQGDEREQNIQDLELSLDGAIMHCEEALRT